MFSKEVQEQRVEGDGSDAAFGTPTWRLGNEE